MHSFLCKQLDIIGLVCDQRTPTSSESGKDFNSGVEMPRNFTQGKNYVPMDAESDAWTWTDGFVQTTANLLSRTVYLPVQVRMKTS